MKVNIEYNYVVRKFSDLFNHLNYLNYILLEIVHDYPAANSVYLRHLEEYQIDEAAKRCEEVKAIKKEMRSIDERAKKIWSTK